MGKILHVEDNESITTLLGEMIDLLGHEYHYALNGHDGIKMMNENDFDLILIDLTMPKFSGIDMLHELLNYHHSGKIMVLTANELSTGQVKELEELEVIEIIQKPITLETLSKTLSLYEKTIVKVC